MCARSFRPRCASWPREAEAEILSGHAVVATEGGKALSGIKVQRFDMANGALTGDARSIHADCLLMSGGWSPTIHLASQAGAKAEWNAARQAFLPPRPTQNWIGAGAFTGSFSTAEAIAEGRAAGLSAAGGTGTPSALPVVEAAPGDPDPAPVFEIRAKGKSFVDFQHDVTAEDVRLAHREGFVSVEHLKRYTTLGMATDQGKSSNVPGLAIMAEALGKPIPEVGTTRFRPPFSPVSIGSLAAERFGDLKPERLTPMHDWHVANGATMYSAGLWYRPMIYGHAGETVEQAYVREAKATRESAGIVDVSTLGKIAVQGPDAAEFLDRVYTNMFSTLAVGKARYGLMLREDGLAFDDGTTWRLGEQDFLMTTTTANAGKVMQHLEYFLDVIWPELKVHVTSVTDEWAGAAIGGPKAREILAACVTGTAVDNAALPFMGIVHGEIAGVPVMICRLSFSGEMAFEVYSGAGYGTHVWEALIEAGKPFGLVTYGLEALGTMRIEKGHVTGAEIDGRTTARDLHLDWMLSKKKPFIGSAMMDREGLIAADRLQLVGLISLDNRPLNGGAHIVEELDEANPHDSIGHITACCYSPALGKHIALALVEGGKARHGTRAYRLRSAAQPVRPGRDRLQPFLRSGREPHAWLSANRRSAAGVARRLAWQFRAWRRRHPDRNQAGLDRAARRLAGRGEEADRRRSARSPASPCPMAPAAACTDGVRSVFGFAPGKFTVVDEAEGPGRRPLPRSSPRPSARSPTCRMAAPRSASPDRRPNGCWRNSSPSTSRCRPFRSAPAARPPITTSSPRSSAPAPTSSTSMSSARSRARSGRRSAMPARKSATRCSRRRRSRPLWHQGQPVLPLENPAADATMMEKHGRQTGPRGMKIPSQVGTFVWFEHPP